MEGSNPSQCSRLDVFKQRSAFRILFHKGGPCFRKYVKHPTYAGGTEVFCTLSFAFPFSGRNARSFASCVVFPWPETAQQPRDTQAGRSEGGGVLSPPSPAKDAQVPPNRSPSSPWAHPKTPKKRQCQSVFEFIVGTLTPMAHGSRRVHSKQAQGGCPGVSGAGRPGLLEERRGRPGLLGASTRQRSPPGPRRL